MNFENQTILLTGATGFTGLHLKKRLLGLGATVVGISNVKSDTSNSDLIYAPLQNKDLVHDAVAKVQPDYVIHLAGISFANHDNALPYYEVNVLGTENLLKACRDIGGNIKKIILASSAAVYGDPKIEFISESQAPAPLSHYGCSKLTMEHIAKLYADSLNIQMTRPFNYTGPGQPAHFLIPKIVAHFKERKPAIELGNTNITREFSDVRDAVENYIALLASPANGIVNLCSGQAHSFIDILETMTAITGHKIEVKTNPEFVRPNDIMRLVGDSTRLVEQTGRKAAFTLRDTLSAMVGDT